MTPKLIQLLGLLLIIPFIFSAPVTVGDNQPWNQYAFQSKINIGGVFLNEVITVSMSYITPIGPPTVSFEISLLDASTGAQIPNHPNGNPYLIACTSNPCSVSFPFMTSTPNVIVMFAYSGIAYQFIDGIANPQGITVARINVFGNQQSRPSPQLVERLITIGDFRFHRIYLPEAGDVQIKIFYEGPDSSGLISDQHAYIDLTDINGKLNIIKMAPEVSNNYNLATTVATDIFSFFDSSQTGYLLTFTGLSAGFHWIIVDVNAIPSFRDASFLRSWNYRIEYKTQRYTCPNDPDNYPDTSGIYQGCIFPSSIDNFPCTIFDNATQACTECLVGYTLTQGRCFVNPCPTGYYRRYGMCKQNPVGCEIFDFFTNCTLCKPTYALTNGTCNRIPLACPNRTYYNIEDYICSPVSERCAAFDSTNGHCLTCLSIKDIVINGSCVASPDPGCADRQYIKNGACFDVDSLCALFERFGGKCTVCVRGYKLNNNGICIEIQCPPRYYPDEYGLCRQISPLCVTFDLLGRCLTCVPGHQVNSNGTCLQSQRPNPCPARQYLGFDKQCHDNADKCAKVNSIDKTCIECVPGYYLLYTGECVPQVNCTQRQYIINNQCHDVSPTCGSFDKIHGKCLNCISAEFQLYYGLCINKFTCGDREWTDQNKKCRAVSPHCRTFNPSNGLCTSCVDNLVFFSGICCPVGQFYKDGICVTALNASLVFSTDGCTLYFESLGCLRCQNGYQKIFNDLGYGQCRKGF